MQKLDNPHAKQSANFDELHGLTASQLIEYWYNQFNEGHIRARSTPLKLAMDTA